MKRQNVGMVVGSLGLLATVMFWWTGRPPGPSARVAAEAARPDAPPDEGEAAGPSAPQPVLAIHDLVAEAQNLASQAPSSGPESEGLLEAATQAVLRRDPRMSEFHRIREKALRTSEERKRYSALVADREMIARARDVLLAGLASELSQAQELERVLQVRYLNDALAEPGNPMHEEALMAATDVILAVVPPGATAEARGSLLGDKIELYQHLLLTDPQHAEALMERARGTHVRDVLAMARSMYEGH